MKTSTKSDPRSALIGKYVNVKRSSYNLKYRINTFDGFEYEGVVVEASENSPFKVGDSYGISINELKYHSVIS